MTIHYRIRKEDEIEIVRCFGTDGRVVIPAEIEGKKVTSAAPYTFSEHKDSEDTDVLVWKDESLVSFGSREQLLAGKAVEELVLPEGLREIGRYIFYGCKELKKLEFSDNLTQIGSGAFTGCSGVRELKIHMKKGQKSCVGEILGELWQRIDVTFIYEDEKAENGIADFMTAGLVFPEHYDLAVENTPARILFTEYHGSGSNYRQCFYGKELNYHEYDKLFPMAVVMDKLEVLVDMSLKRLEFPYELTEKNRQEYTGYIRKNLEEIAEFLVGKKDLHRLEIISQEKLWDMDTLGKTIDCAVIKGETEMAAFLMNERERLWEKAAPGEDSKQENPPKKNRKSRFAL